MCHWISTYKRGKLPTKIKTKAVPMHSLDDEAVEESDCEIDDVQDDHTDVDSDEGGV